MNSSATPSMTPSTKSSKIKVQGLNRKIASGESVDIENLIEAKNKLAAKDIRKPIILVEANSQKLKKSVDQKHLFEALNSIEALFLVAKNEAELEEYLEIADICITWNTNEEHLKECLAEEAIPVCPANDTFADYDPINEKGNCFEIKQNTVWGVFYEVARAIETYRFPYDWKHLLKPR